MRVERQWRMKGKPSDAEIKRLSAELKTDSVTATLLLQRGVHNKEESRKFFRPHQDDLHDPFSMKDMDKAVSRIQRAIEQKEKIMIFGDYDVDGTTGTALLCLFFTSTLLRDDKKQISYYIPDRYTEGYGISTEGIDYAIKTGVKLIIAIDCGIKAIEKVLYANNHGVEMIICDHHMPGDSLPAAVAVLDPKRNDCNYPYKELSGCAVGFKLLQALTAHYKLDQDYLFSLIDLVAVSIASDIVAITGENRVLAFLGLEKINSKPLNGLKAIMAIAGMDDKRCRIDDIVFKIGPRINAAGRLYSGRTVVQLLISGDKVLATELSKKINAYNIERKQLDKEITQEAIEMINNDAQLASLHSTVLYKETWHKGVVGIVASRVIDMYYRPTIILTRSNGLVTGSARSVEGFDLYQAIEKCSHLLEKFGGHSHAAGLSLKPENIEPFRQLFEQVVAESILPEQLIPGIDIDAEIGLHSVTGELVKSIAEFEPFGPGNMTPLFCTHGVTERGTARPVGATGEHLKIDISDPADPQKILPGIAFGQVHRQASIRRGKPFDICYSIETNEFRGKTTIQLNIRDFAFGDEG